MAQNESVNMAQSEGNNGTQNGNATWNATIDRSESVNGTQNGNVTIDRSESVNGTQNGNVTIARSESGNVAQNESNNTGQVVQNGSNNREQVRDEQPREIWFTDDIWQMIVDYNNDYGTARALQMVNRRIGSLVPGRGGWWRLRQSRRYFMFRAEQFASFMERDVYVCGWCNTYKHRSEFADDQVTGDRRKGAVGAYQRHCLTCAV